MTQAGTGQGARGLESDPDLAYCTDLVRRTDPDRFFAALFAPAARRSGLIALYAFYLELARLPELVTEPMVGAIRQQWWRDGIADLARGTPPPHPVMRALAPWIGQGIDPDGLIAQIDARETDFDEIPFETPAAVDAYAQATASGLMTAAMGLLAHPALLDSADRDLAARGGRLWARLGLLRSLGFWAGRRRLLLSRADLAATGIGPETVFAGSLTADQRAALESLIRDQAAVLQGLAGQIGRCAIPGRFRPALAYLGQARALLNALEKTASEPLTRPAAPGHAPRMARLLWTLARGRI